MIEFDNKIDNEIANAIRNGRNESLTACACMGCRDLIEGSCLCGANCKCRCKLEHRRQERTDWNQRVMRVRLALRKAGEMPDGEQP